MCMSVVSGTITVIIYEFVGFLFCFWGFWWLLFFVVVV